MLMDAITIINQAILWYFIILSCGYLLLLLVSIQQIFHSFKETEVGNIVSLTQSIALPAITIIIPAFNESALLIDTVESALKSKYPNTFITIINPSSTDDMLKKLIDKYQLYPITPLIQIKIKTNGAVTGYYVSKLYKNLTVINKEHTDRSDTLNVGINACHTPLFMTLDADTLIEPDAINNILFYMLCHPNMIAAGGAVFVLNGCLIKDGVIISPNMSGKPLYAFQTCEYLRSFYFDRVGWNTFGGALSYAGAFTLFDIKTVIEIGGYQINNLAQDFEIITHLHEYARENNIPYKIGYTPSAAVWTDVPGTVKTYWKQRYNWQYSILQSLMAHKKMFFNPKFGVIGLFTYPFFWFSEALSAIVELVAYLSIILTWYLGILDVIFAIEFFLLCWGFQIGLSRASAVLSYATFNRYGKNKYILWRIFYNVIEIFGFRQFNVVCRVIATFAYFFKSLKFSKIKSQAN